MYTRKIYTFKILWKKSSERLTQANEEELIINYRLPNVHICNKGICFEIVFSISSNDLRKNILFRFIAPSIPTEIYSLNNIDKKRICRTKRHLTEKSLDGQLIDNDIKKFRQDIKSVFVQEITTINVSGYAIIYVPRNFLIAKK